MKIIEGAHTTERTQTEETKETCNTQTNNTTVRVEKKENRRQSNKKNPTCSIEEERREKRTKTHGEGQKERGRTLDIR
jgi:hypothetical protein